jgi:hypothetical protein
VNAPETIEGWQAWEVFLQCQGQVRAVGSVVVGLDFNAVMAMANSLGYDLRSMTHFLPALEAGLLTGLREQAQTAVD